MIFDIQRYSIHDGPGIRTLIFMKGCPLRCLWCSNPESQFQKQEMMLSAVKCISCGKCIEVCPTGAAGEKNPAKAKKLCRNCGKCVEVCPSTARQMVGKNMAVAEVMEEIERDVRFYRRSSGGITVTGGEPLMQPEYVQALLKECNARDIDTAIETCGYSDEESLKKVIPYVDLVLYDIKHMDKEKHQEITGYGNAKILENARLIVEMHKDIIIRIPVIPGYNDSDENIENTAKFARTLNKVDEINLMPYHNFGESKYNSLGKHYQLEGIKSLERKALSHQKKILESYKLKVKIGG